MLLSQKVMTLGLARVSTVAKDLKIVERGKRYHSRFKPVINPPAVLKRPSGGAGRSNNTVGVAAGIFASKGMACERMTVEDAIIWVDCEMSGLDVSKETIMEISVIITGPKLDVIATHPPLIIKTEDVILDSMGAWCVQHHGQSGLTDGCRKSNITIQDADKKLLEFVSKYTEAGSCPMGGNSIYMDRMFISKYMPNFHKHFHYRNVDVSSIKELVRRWFPDEYYKAPKKRFEHRTTADIEDSIEELKYYRSAVFIKSLEETDSVAKNS